MKTTRLSLLFLLIFFQQSVNCQDKWINFTGSDGVDDFFIIGDTVWVSHQGGISWVDLNDGSLLHNLNSGNSEMMGNSVFELEVNNNRKAWWLGLDHRPAPGTQGGLHYNRLQYFDGEAMVPAATNLSVIDGEYPLFNLTANDNDELYFRQYITHSDIKLWQLINQELSEIPLPEGYTTISNIFSYEAGKVVGIFNNKFGVWNGGNWSLYDAPSGFSNGTLIPDAYGYSPDGKLYIIIRTNGDKYVFQFDGESLNFFMDGLLNREYSFLWNESGTFYLAYDNYLKKIENGTITTSIFLPYIGSNGKYSKHIWLGEDDLWSIASIEGESLNRLSIANNERSLIKIGNSHFPSNRVRQLGINSKLLKTFYLGNDQYSRFDGTNWNDFEITDIYTGIQDNEIIFLPDRQGNTFIYRLGGGLHQFYMDDGLETFNYSLSNGSRNQVLLNQDGNLIFSSDLYQEHFGQLDASGIFSETDILEYEEYTNNPIAVDSEGKLWLYHDYYLFKDVQFYDGTAWQTVYLPNNVHFTEISGPLIDQEDRVIFTTNQGEVLIYDQNEESWNAIPFNEPEQIWPDDVKMLEDSKGNIWFMASTFGLFKFDGTEWNRFTPINSGLSSLFITDFDIDSLDNIWICTEHGLTVYNEEGITSLGNSPFARLEGRIYYDINHDEQYHDSIDAKFTHVALNVFPYTQRIYSNDAGKYGTSVTPDTFQVTLQEIPFWSPTGGNVQEVIMGIQNELEVDFRMVPDILFEAVDVQIAAEPARCGRTVHYFVAAKNTGTALLSGRIAIAPSPLSVIMEAEPALTYDQTENLYYYYFENLKPFEQIQLELKVQIASFMHIGEEVNWHASVQTLNNGLYQNVESISNSQVLACSYDPNDKLVQPIGPSRGAESLAENELIYTIRFQNTGNAEAFDIEIIDTLDTRLDINTFRIIQATHTHETYIEEENIAHFVFKNINLPDSTSNEEGSHGLIQYDIKIKEEVELPVEVLNTAYIYFDQNPAIQTNTTTNTLVLGFPVATTEQSALQIPIELYPNPTTGVMTLNIKLPLEDDADITIYTCQGELIKALKLPRLSSTTIMDLRHLPAGSYFLQLRTSMGTNRVSFIKM